MNPRLKACLLWGVVGALSFLVLAQGYRLVFGRGIGYLPMLGVAVVVGFVAAGATYAVESAVGSKRRL